MGTDRKKMAGIQTSSGDRTAGLNGAGDGDGKTVEKRRSTDQPHDAPPQKQKKISMSFGTKPNSSASKISFNLGSSTGMAQNKLDKGKVSNQVLPIKMSLGSVQKAKETPPSVVQKSALAAKVFDES